MNPPLEPDRHSPAPDPEVAGRARSPWRTPDHAEADKRAAASTGHPILETGARALESLRAVFRRRGRTIVGLLTVLVAAIGMGVPLIASKPAAAERSPAPIVRSEIMPNRIVVDLRDDIGVDEIRAIGEAAGIVLRFNSVHSESSRLMIADGPPEVLARALEILRADSRVESAEPSFIYKSFAVRQAPDDPLFGEQWNFAMIGIEEAWKIATGKGITVAVIDSGVAGRDTAQNIAIEDLDGSRIADGFDFVEDDDDFQDGVGHGTHVAGTIAGATDNGRGVAGLARDATLLPLRVLGDNGSGETADIADAVRYAADHGAKVINMSLGGSSYSKILEDACAEAKSKGVLIVCAAGNSGREGVMYPAAYPACLAVSSVGPSKSLAPYSTWGKEIAIAAPGGDLSVGSQGGILQNVCLRARGRCRRDVYASFQGTSMASPHVAGVAALIMSLGIGDPDQVRRILTETAEPAGDSKHYGAGILDAQAALERAKREAPALSGWPLGKGLLAGLLLLFPPIRRRLPAVVATLRGALPLAFGFAAPSVVQWIVGAASSWNLLGHSVLWLQVLPRAIPGTFTSSRAAGFAIGLALHLAVDWRGAPGSLPGGIPIGASTWLAVNLALIGFRFLVTPAPASLASHGGSRFAPGSAT